MKKLLFIVFIVASALSFAHAQELRKSQPDSLIKPIPFGYGPHTGYLFTVGGKLQTPDEIKARLLSYAPSAAEFSTAKKDVTWGFVFSGGAGVAGIGAVIAFSHANRLNGAAFNSSGTGFVYQDHNKTGAYILTGAAIGFLTASITTWINGAIHAHRSIYLYNQQYQ